MGDTHIGTGYSGGRGSRGASSKSVSFAVGRAEFQSRLAISWVALSKSYELCASVSPSVKCHLWPRDYCEGECDLLVCSER